MKRIQLEKYSYNPLAVLKPLAEVIIVSLRMVFNDVHLELESRYRYL